MGCSVWAEYPDKQITFVVPFAAGSATDQLARALRQEVTRISKQAVIVSTLLDRAAGDGDMTCGRQDDRHMDAPLIFPEGLP